MISAVLRPATGGRTDRGVNPHMLVVAVCMGLLVYETARAVRVPLTYDEAASYLRYISADVWAVFRFDIATNHFLNTLLTKLSSLVFGTSELALRLPNLAGYAMYLYYSVRVLRLLRHRGIAVAAFLVLNLNPYILDYFSLSRGYGLSLGLMAAALFYVIAFLRDLASGSLDSRALSRGLGFACASVLASFTMIDVFLAILATVLAAVVVFRRISHADAATSPGVERRSTTWWSSVFLVGAVTFTVLVLSQDVALSEGLYEPAILYVNGLTEADLAMVRVLRFDVREHARAMQRQPASATWHDSFGGHITRLRVEMPSSAAQSLPRVAVVIGQRTFTGAGLWDERDVGDTRVLDSAPSLSLGSSREPLYRSIINWRGDARHAAVVAADAAVVLAILGAFWVLLRALGTAGVGLRLWQPSDWRPVATSLTVVAAGAATPLYQLQRNGELYFGGTEGLVKDSFYSVVRESFYGQRYHPLQAEFVFWAVLSAVGLYGLTLCFAGRRRGMAETAVPAGALLAVAALVSVSILLQHALFHTPYPLERTALFYVPLAVLFMALVGDGLARLGGATAWAASVIAVSAAAFSSYHFLSVANTTSTNDWRRDAGTKAMITDLRELVAHDAASSTDAVIGVDRMYFAPAVYYATRKPQPAIRVVVMPTDDRIDFYYGHERPNGDGWTVVNTYPSAGTRLARVGQR
jgi:hypothetical protein